MVQRRRYARPVADPRSLRALPSLPDRVDSLDGRIAAHDSRLDQLSARIDELEGVLSSVRAEVRQLTEAVGEVLNRIAAEPPQP